MDSTSTPCSAGSIEREEAASPSEREEAVSEREDAVSEREEAAGPSSSRIKLGPVPLTTPFGVASTPPVTSKFSLCRWETSPLALLFLRPLRKAPAAATPATPPTKPYRKGGSEKRVVSNQVVQCFRYSRQASTYSFAVGQGSNGPNNGGTTQRIQDPRKGSLGALATGIWNTFLARISLDSTHFVVFGIRREAIWTIAAWKWMWAMVALICV
jgi:hypothetical protein